MASSLTSIDTSEALAVEGVAMRHQETFGKQAHRAIGCDFVNLPAGVVMKNLALIGNESKPFQGANFQVFCEHGENL